MWHQRSKPLLEVTVERKIGHGCEEEVRRGTAVGWGSSTLTFLKEMATVMLNVLLEDLHLEGLVLGPASKNF